MIYGGIRKGERAELYTKVLDVLMCVANPRHLSSSLNDRRAALAAGRALMAFIKQVDALDCPILDVHWSTEALFRGDAADEAASALRDRERAVSTAMIRAKLVISHARGLLTQDETLLRHCELLDEEVRRVERCERAASEAQARAEQEAFPEES